MDQTRKGKIRALRRLDVDGMGPSSHTAPQAGAPWGVGLQVAGGRERERWHHSKTRSKYAALMWIPDG